MIIVIALFVSAVVGALIGIQKEKAGKGALLGLFFGPIGWVLMIYDAGFLIIAALALVGIFLLIAGIRSDEEYKEELQAAQHEEIRGNQSFQTQRAWSIFGGNR